MLKNPFKKKSIADKYKNLINEINALESSVQMLTDSEIRNKTIELKKRYKEEQDLNALITEAFALTREASVRTLGTSF